MKKVISVGLFLALGLAVSCSSDTNNPPPGCSPACTGGQVCTAGACVTPPPPLACTTANQATACTTFAGNICSTAAATAGTCVCGSADAGTACASGSECIGVKCAKYRTMFVTTQAFTTGTAFGGTATASTTIKSASDADDACQFYATAKGLTGKFAAVIATIARDPVTRISTRIPNASSVNIYNYYNNATSSRTLIAGNIQDLLGGTVGITNPVLTDVGGSGGSPFTGSSKVKSKAAASGSDNCADWSSAGSTNTAIFGNSRSTTIGDWYSSGTQACNLAAPLYCIQVDQ